MLIGSAGTTLDIVIRIQSLGGQQQPLRAGTRDRVRVLPAVLLKLALALPQPGIPPLPPTPDDVLRVQVKRQLLRRLALALDQLGALLLALTLSLDLAEELTPALQRAQLLGQLITAFIAI